MDDPGGQWVIGIGELLWDCFPDRRLPGGAPANVIFHATLLGHPARIASRIGRDADGEGLRREIESRGLSTELLQVDDTLPTGRVTIDDRDPSAPDYVIHRDVAWEAIEPEAALTARVGEAAAVCVGTLAQRGARSRRTIHHCLGLAGGALKVYDVNLRRDGYQRAWIEATLGAVDVVKLNLDEVVELASLLALESDRPEPFARLLLDRFELKLVCVTRGDAGSLLVAPDEVVDSPGRPAQVADSVGAGDAFTAALISGRLRGWPLRRTATLANAVGALVAAREGAMPRLEGEIEACLEEVGT